jgi:hypothetical protein
MHSVSENIKEQLNELQNESEIEFHPYLVRHSTINKISRKRRLNSETLQHHLKSNDNSMTFNVEFASTPKKSIPRSSTPKRLTTRVKAKNERVRKQAEPVQTPFSSTVLSVAQIIQENSNHSSQLKTIPPPLLSSSLIKPSVQNSTRKILKRLNEKKNLTECYKSIQKKNCSLKCKYSCSKPKKKSTAIISSTLKTLKYPIKFYPNVKSQDINRLSTKKCSQFDCDPQMNIYCYGNYGDYNVWIL